MANAITENKIFALSGCGYVFFILQLISFINRYNFIIVIFSLSIIYVFYMHYICTFFSFHYLYFFYLFFNFYIAYNFNCIYVINIFKYFSILNYINVPIIAIYNFITTKFKRL